jgi:HEPN domain-containing protein
MSSRESNWQAWVRKAEHDLLNVRNNLIAEEVPWDTVCFHAQQAAEKMLKALLVLRGVEPERTHDLVALLQECLAQDPDMDGLRASCLLLNPYSIDARYPAPTAAAEELEAPDESEGKMAVEAAERVFSAVLGRLRAPHGGAGKEAGP